MKLSVLDDLQLLHLLQENNEEAFAEIYSRYWKTIYAQALQYSKSPETAKDIVQDVFLKIWTNRASLQHVQDVKAYLFISARNKIISNLRNKISHSTLDAEESIEEQMLLPDRQFSYKESVALLYQAIELLPPQQRRAYQLSRNEGLRYEDIATQMGISRLTVRAHITKAIAFIRQYLAGHSVVHLLFVLLLLQKKF